MSERRSSPAWRTMVIVGVVAFAAASVAVYPAVNERDRVIDEHAAAPGSSATAGPIMNSPGSATKNGPGVPGVSSGDAGLACAAGRNGGATDVGVTGTSIKIGATVVDSGIGASFLRDARYAMIAVKNRINRAGGICGRRLELVLRDDGWDFQRGGDFLRNLVEQEKVFALAVVPSSEGLLNISRAGYLRAKRVPVVGSDGMLIHQYTDPYIWPVAASTISTLHIMVAHAAKQWGAKNFGIVYESTYHFGIEGAYAFNQAVRRVTSSSVPGYSNPLTSPGCAQRFCGISATAGNYSREIQTFNDACFTEPKCDFIALLLEPATALAWIKAGATMPPDGFRMGGVQPLFTRNFAEECRERCHNLWLWTGYDPPIGGDLGRPAMRSYVDDVRGASGSADSANTFVEGAYVGMSLLEDALRRVGPNLTRARLKAMLDSMTFRSGLSSPLSWRPGDHFANVTMRAFSIQYRDRFAGWADERATVADPWVGKDIP
jgi:ABC-type branched-subunit amino acid transport system substrate-binding protein